jgi:hypothetical protein
MTIDVPARRIGSLIHSERSDHILYRGRFSPDAQWVAFDAALDKSLNKRVFISQIRDGHGTSEANWIAVTDGLQVDAYVAWSPDGNLLYFLSERDGFRCIWAQRLTPATKQPNGAPFPVRHFHNARESLARVDRFDLVGLSAARDKVVFSMSEQTAPRGSFSRWISAVF